jgi:hypothetical protein
VKLAGRVALLIEITRSHRFSGKTLKPFENKNIVQGDARSESGQDRNLLESLRIDWTEMLYWLK